MANANMICGYYNLPWQNNPATTGEFDYLVPAVGAYPSLPTPYFAAATALVVCVPPDVDAVGSNAAARAISGPSKTSLDGKLFNVRVAGKVYSHTTQNLTIKIYQVSAAVIAAGTQAHGTGTAIASTSTLAVTGTAAYSNFIVNAKCLWDSVSESLSGLCIAQIDSQRISGGALTVQSADTSVAAKDLNFLVSFTLSSGTTADKVALTEFTVERA